MLGPLEVFAVDGAMNRATGSIPYDSLTWSRRYYECGQFQMRLPASIYDPTWKFIECDDRPETGIIQKVVYTDDPEYGNGDTVEISGFFLESIMNRRTFLDETPEEVTERYYVAPPKPPKEELTSPKIYTDSQGRYWYSTSSGTSYGVADGTPSDSDARIPGGSIQVAEDGTAKVETGSGTIDLTEVNYFDQGNSFYYNEGSTTKVHRVQNFGTGYEDTEHDLAFDDGFGNVYYHDSKTGTLKRATGVTEKAEDNYYVTSRKWKSEYGESGGWVEYTKTVKGPWQLTDTLDPITPADNVARCVQWARMYFQNDLLFEEPEITGEVKAVDPSFMLLGDLLYQELQTVEASLRVEYQFQSNQFIFSVWRGLDRTQRTNSPETARAKKLAAPVARAAAQRSASVPAGYMELEYIQSTGAQYINAGVVPGGNTRVVAEVEFQAVDDGRFLFGARGGNNSNAYTLCCYRNEHRSDYYTNSSNMFNVQNAHFSLDKNKGTTYVDGTVVSQANYVDFSSGNNMFLFAVNNNGSPSGHSTSKIYSMQIMDSDVLLRDFVPCKRESDGEVGLFDKVSQSLFLNAGTGSFVAGPEVVISDMLTYMPGDDRATGVTPPTEGIEGQQVTVAQCGFQLESGTFLGWSTLPEGGGTVYQPGDKYTLTAGDDVLYAWWKVESPIAGDKAPWAVFSDTWGSLYGYTAGRDDSNYRNVCYVLYEYEEPLYWEEDGAPALTPSYKEFDENGVFVHELTGWSIQYKTNRGYIRATIEDGEEYDDRETYLDLRNESPVCDSEWSREFFSVEDYPDGPPTQRAGMQAQYEAYPESLKSQGLALLQNDYKIETTLDTGDLRTDRYLVDYDLGDKVDMMVETVGLVQEARIIGVDEVYEPNDTKIALEIGVPKLDILKKARRI